MNPEPDHCPNALLQEYVDGVLSGRNRKGVADHLALCDSCRRSAAAFRRLDGVLRSMPNERAGLRLASSVMEVIGAGGHPDPAYRLLVGGAAVCGMTTLAGMILAILFSTGILDARAGGEQAPPDASWLGSAAETLGRFASAGLDIVQKHSSFLSPSHGIEVWLFALAVIGSLGGVDFLIRRRRAET